ncbi:MAG: GlxA family transcriptional regulator [Kineosporiaceae bacterium]
MTIAVLAVDGMFDSGLTVLLDVLATAEALTAAVPGAPAAPAVSVLGVGRHARTGLGLSVDTVPFDEAPGRPEVVVCPALKAASADALVAAVRGHPALGWLDRQASTGVGLAAACTGTFFLAEAGLLDHRAATTSWWYAPHFRRRYPAVRLDDRLSLVEDRGVVTAGAALAHADLALWLVARRSPALADEVARHLLIGARASQAVFAIPAHLASGDPLLNAFERWVRANLDRPSVIADACGALGVSERTLQRVTAARLGTTPIGFVQDIRLDHATHLLRTTDLTADAVARAVGYGTAATLRALARRRRGVTPRQLAAGRAAAP